MSGHSVTVMFFFSFFPTHFTQLNTVIIIVLVQVVAFIDQLCTQKF